jgi:hypothetical protein
MRRYTPKGLPGVYRLSILLARDLGFVLGRDDSCLVGLGRFVVTRLEVPTDCAMTSMRAFHDNWRRKLAERCDGDGSNGRKEGRERRKKGRKRSGCTRVDWREGWRGWGKEDGWLAGESRSYLSLLTCRREQHRDLHRQINNVRALMQEMEGLELELELVVGGEGKVGGWL